MPSLSVGNDTHFYYEDSGPSESSDYVTLVFVHGIVYNGDVLRHIFPLAAKHNFRLVCLYRRGYPPSSPLGQDDLKRFTGSREEQISYLHDRGVEIGNFLNQFIIENGIPPAAGNRGGIALVGWSLGTFFVHAAISSLDSLSPETIANLSKYLHTVIQYDTLTKALGASYPPGWDLSHIFTETDLGKRFALFNEVFASYYDNEDTISGDLTKISFKPNGQMTFQGMSLEDFATFAKTEALLFGVDVALEACDQELMIEINRRVCQDVEMAKLLPDLRIRYFHGAKSVGLVVWAVWELQKRSTSIVRDVKVVPCETGNHFMFWDEPEATLVQFRRCIDA